jgi:hypothetical protein
MSCRCRSRTPLRITTLHYRFVTSSTSITKFWSSATLRCLPGKVVSFTYGVCYTWVELAKAGVRFQAVAKDVFFSTAFIPASGPTKLSRVSSVRIAKAWVRFQVEAKYFLATTFRPATGRYSLVLRSRMVVLYLHSPLLGTTLTLYSMVMGLVIESWELKLEVPCRSCSKSCALVVMLVLDFNLKRLSVYYDCGLIVVFAQVICSSCKRTVNKICHILPRYFRFSPSACAHSSVCRHRAMSAALMYIWHRCSVFCSATLTLAHPLLRYIIHAFKIIHVLMVTCGRLEN